MELKDFFLEKLEQESEASRKVLERVPEGRNDWKPHDKSMALGQLAALVATVPSSIAATTHHRAPSTPRTIPIIWSYLRKPQSPN